jgi:hypothetical protein
MSVAVPMLTLQYNKSLTNQFRKMNTEEKVFNFCLFCKNKKTTLSSKIVRQLTNKDPLFFNKC